MTQVWEVSAKLKKKKVVLYHISILNTIWNISIKFISLSDHAIEFLSILKKVNVKPWIRRKMNFSAVHGRLTIDCVTLLNWQLHVISNCNPTKHRRPQTGPQHCALCRQSSSCANSGLSQITCTVVIKNSWQRWCRFTIYLLM